MNYINEIINHDENLKYKKLKNSKFQETVRGVPATLQIDVA